MIIVAAVVVSSLVWPSLRKFYTNRLVLVPQVSPARPPLLHVSGLTRAEVDLVYAGLTLLLIAIIVASVILIRRRAATAEQRQRADGVGANLQQAVG